MTKMQYDYEIGIGVTEHNRPDTFKEFLKNIKKFMPKGAKFVIVDDASSVPVKNADYRFEQNVGIARAKNKCLELLQDCEHIFLFDSDCWPLVDDWYVPYVESREPHLMYIFKDLVNAKLNDSRELYRDSKIVAYSHPRGCMLYMHNSVLKKAGGMDTNYKRWGYEHVDYSNRIYNVGMTQFRYQDVPDSNKLIYSLDEQMLVDSTVSVQERQPYLAEMRQYFEKSFNSTNFAPFVEPIKEKQGTEDIVITVYFTGVADPQRGQWEANLSDCNALITSVASKGQKLVILHDNPEWEGMNIKTPGVELVMVETSLNPYFQRWVSIWSYLRDHPEIRNVFCVDATDVEMLRNPFPEMEQGKLYVGSETVQTWNNWMVLNHRVPFIQNFLRQAARLALLNPGVIGGSRNDVMELLRTMNKIYFDEKFNVGQFDMGLFNYVVRTFFVGKFETGPKVHTKFKMFEKFNQVAWWKHK
jgi:glycosyltransferase involved in cell wall biosynthesis